MPFRRRWGSLRWLGKFLPGRQAGTVRLPVWPGRLRNHVERSLESLTHTSLARAPAAQLVWQVWSGMTNGVSAQMAAGVAFLPGAARAVGDGLGGGRMFLATTLASVAAGLLFQMLPAFPGQRSLIILSSVSVCLRTQLVAPRQVGAPRDGYGTGTPLGSGLRRNDEAQIDTLPNSGRNCFGGHTLGKQPYGIPAGLPVCAPLQDLLEVCLAGSGGGVLALGSQQNPVPLALAEPGRLRPSLRLPDLRHSAAVLGVFVRSNSGAGGAHQRPVAGVSDGQPYTSQMFPTWQMRFTR